MSECYCGTMMDARECDHCLVTTLRKRVGELEEQVADYCNDAEAWRELYQKEAVEINIVGPDEAKKLADYVNKELQARVEDLEAQLLESADLGWHNLRNQRDALLKRVAALEERHKLTLVQAVRIVRLLKALEEIASGSAEDPYKSGRDIDIAAVALKPCDPTE